MTEFLEFAKITRLSRECVVTEKIDGTNAQVYIVELPAVELQHAVEIPGGYVAWVGDRLLFAGSRNRWLASGHGDNFGFAAWVKDHAEELAQLGPGRHFGEWWGSGVQRGYGLTNGEKRFSLFNVARWADERDREKFPGDRPSCCHVVPVLASAVFDTGVVEVALTSLRVNGSAAAPGFMQPEGVVVFHRASGTLFKKTLEKDDERKRDRR